jgi:hypothetical protein
VGASKAGDFRGGQFHRWCEKARAFRG